MFNKNVCNLQQEISVSGKVIKFKGYPSILT